MAGILDPYFNAQGNTGFLDPALAYQAQTMMQNAAPQVANAAPGSNFDWGSDNPLWMTLLGAGAGLSKGTNWREGLGTGLAGALTGLEAAKKQQTEQQDRMLKALMLQHTLAHDTNTENIAAANLTQRQYANLPPWQKERTPVPGTTGGESGTGGVDQGMSAPQYQNIPNAAPGMTMEQTFTNTSALRKEFASTPEVRGYTQAVPFYKTAEQTAGRNTRASDLNLVFAVAKMFNPTVSREGDRIDLQTTEGLSDQILGAIKALQGTGATLGQDARNSLLDEARIRMGVLKSQVEPLQNQYTDIATRNGLNPKDVFGGGLIDVKPPNAAPPWPAGATQSFASEAAARAAGLKDGDPVIINGVAGTLRPDQAAGYP